MLVNPSLSRDSCLQMLKSALVLGFVRNPAFAGFCFHSYDGDASFGINMEEGSDRSSFPDFSGLCLPFSGSMCQIKCCTVSFQESVKVRVA